MSEEYLDVVLVPVADLSVLDVERVEVHVEPALRPPRARSAHFRSRSLTRDTFPINILSS